MMPRFLADVEAGGTIAHTVEQPPRAAIEIVHGDDMRAVIEAVERGRDRRKAGREGEGRLPPFEIGDAALERHAGRILGAGIVEALVHPRRLLDVGGRGVDRHHHGAGGRIGLLPRMHAAGGKAELVRFVHGVILK
jgi:hypothetical protein